MNEISVIPDAKIQTESGEVLELGTWLGRKQAFAEVAGRCSAADAECLRQVRKRKMHRKLKMSWRDFCKQHLGMAGATADLIIRRLEEFGPSYFVLAQATGITESEYRRISSAVRDQKLLHAGEEIPITAENAPRLAAAVEALRRASTPTLPAPLSAEADAKAGAAGTYAAAGPAAESAGSTMQDVFRSLEQAERTLTAAVDQIARLHNMSLSRAQRDRLLRSVVKQLHRIPLFQLSELRRAS